VSFEDVKKIYLLNCYQPRTLLSGLYATYQLFPDQEILMSTPIQKPEDLGRLVRETRKRLKLTQPQLALAANVGVRFIVELEAGKSTLRLENILRVLQALGGVLCLEGMDSFINAPN